MAEDEPSGQWDQGNELARDGEQALGEESKPASEDEGFSGERGQESEAARKEQDSATLSSEGSELARTGEQESLDSEDMEWLGSGEEEQWMEIMEDLEAMETEMWEPEKGDETCVVGDEVTVGKGEEERWEKQEEGGNISSLEDDKERVDVLVTGRDEPLSATIRRSSGAPPTPPLPSLG